MDDDDSEPIKAPSPQRPRRLGQSKQIVSHPVKSVTEFRLIKQAIIFHLRSGR
jgi:hypothetical protein